MGKKSGNKRKKDTNSPNQSVDQENKRIFMANMNGYNGSSPIQGMSQPGQYMAPATFQYTPGMSSMAGMLGAGSPMMSMPSQPQSPGTHNSEQGVMNLILQRLDHMDKKLGQLDTIQSSIASITVKVSDIESKVHTLETKVNTLETSRSFDSESVDALNKKQKEIDSLLVKMKKLEADQSAKESDLQAKVLDMQCRSMRDNLIFYKIPVEAGETDDDCVQKVLNLIENDLGIANASTDIKLHRAHRMGKYDPVKIRPIVAKFAYYPDRENVRKNAGKLKGKATGISQQFPREIMEKRRKLVPIMKEARENGKDAYITVDKLYIDKRLYRGPEA